VLKVIASTTKVKLDVFEDEEEVTVCRLWDEVKEEGKAEGRAEGKTEGKAEGKTEGKAEEIVSTGMEFGMTREEVLSRLERKLGIDGQQALRYYEQFSQQEMAVES
jgi:predicted transposase YdaD